jgi:hypothetical protein
MVAHGGDAGDLLHHALDRWDRGPNLPDQAVLIDLAQPALLLLHDRDLAA